MHFVPQKSIEQQDLQALHRIRSRLVGSRTQLGNQIRAQQARPLGQPDADLPAVPSRGGLKLRRLKKKRLVRTPAASHVVRRNQEWAVDFVHDTLATGRGIRVLAVVDTFTRECVSLEVDSSMSGPRVTRTLEAMIERRGLPESIRCDNVPGVHLAALYRLVLGTQDPTGTHPTWKTDAKWPCGELQRTATAECLNASWFHNLIDARTKIRAWQEEYNGERPHSSLGGRTPNEFAASWNPQL